MARLTAVSLFSSSGMGDLALRSLGVETLVANELVDERARLFKANFPETDMITGDIWEVKDRVVAASMSRLAGRQLDVLLATPPCQGMSSAGQGKLLSEIKKGNRPKLDPRNRLVIPALKIAKILKPRLVIFENVPAMHKTLILDEFNEPITIVDYIRRELGEGYEGSSEVVEFADYGVPQSRKRLLTVYSKDPSLKELINKTGSLIKAPTHSGESGSTCKPWVTLRKAIGHFPSLDARPGKNADPDFHPLHRVAILDDRKYFWISNTPEGKSAFDNQCVNPSCGYQDNPTHLARRDASGVNRASTLTPLYCVRCGSLLPRPATLVDAKPRLMRGYTSAYRRMYWDRVCPTLTQNYSYPSSDSNLHPVENRVLSTFEALTIHTIADFNYRWEVDGKIVREGLIRDSIGESVPPRGFSNAIETAVRGLG